MGKQQKQWETICLGSKITADGDCSPEIKRHLLLGNLPTKVHLVKTMVFPVVHVWMWELDCEESWVPKNWCFWTVVLEKTLESPLDIQQVNYRGNQSWIFTGRTDAEAETNTLASWCKVLTHWKRPRSWERLKAGGEEDDRGWDGWLASLTWWTWVWSSSWSWLWTWKPMCCSPWGCKQLDTTEWLN